MKFQVVSVARGVAVVCFLSGGLTTPDADAARGFTTPDEVR